MWAFKRSVTQGQGIAIAMALEVPRSHLEDAQYLQALSQHLQAQRAAQSTEIETEAPEEVCA